MHPADELGTRGPVTLGPLDIAAGMMIGDDPAVVALDAGDPISPRQALRTLVLRALECPPCLVSFSGGRDSSAMLAVAVDEARRHGLPLPIPITARFPGIEETEEAAWQESMLEHLGLDDWTRVDITDELDAVGPVAATVLRRHGVVYPYNTHFHVPLFERASGGSLITGAAGDELMTPLLWGLVARLLYGFDRVRRPADVARILIAKGPRSVRRRAVAHRLGIEGLPWLRPDVDRRVRRHAVAWYADQPFRFDDALLQWWWRSKYLQYGRTSLTLVAADHDVVVYEPFSDPLLIRAMAQRGGITGFPSRAAAMEDLFGDLLPPATTKRESKALFTEVLFNRHSRAFATGWTGTGVPDDLVDPSRLRDAWLAPEGDCRTLLLMQSAWLAEQRGEDATGGEAKAPAADSQ